MTNYHGPDRRRARQCSRPNACSDWAAIAAVMFIIGLVTGLLVSAV